MNIEVGKIKQRWLRRTVIVVTYPFACTIGLVMQVALGAVAEMVVLQVHLAKSAIMAWKAP